MKRTMAIAMAMGLAGCGGTVLRSPDGGDIYISPGPTVPSGTRVSVEYQNDEIAVVKILDGPYRGQGGMVMRSDLSR